MGKSGKGFQGFLLAHNKPLVVYGGIWEMISGKPVGPSYTHNVYGGIWERISGIPLAHKHP